MDNTLTNFTKPGYDAANKDFDLGDMEEKLKGQAASLQNAGAEGPDGSDGGLVGSILTGGSKYTNAIELALDGASGGRQPNATANAMGTPIQKQGQFLLMGGNKLQSKPSEMDFMPKPGYRDALRQSNEQKKAAYFAAKGKGPAGNKGSYSRAGASGISLGEKSAIASKSLTGSSMTGAEAFGVKCAATPKDAANLNHQAKQTQLALGAVQAAKMDRSAGDLMADALKGDQSAQREIQEQRKPQARQAVENHLRMKGIGGN
jgi:hypothetical protein